VKFHTEFIINITHLEYFYEILITRQETPMVKTHKFEACSLLVYNEAPCGNCLPTFRDVRLPAFFSSRILDP
jgi:hypothetical protein